MFVAATTAEIGLHLWAPEYGFRLFDREFTASKPIEMNGEGYRGVAVPKEKPDGTLRLLALGDSVTFGTGVAAQETWPAQLTAFIVEKMDTRVDAINASMGAASIGQLRFAYENKWKNYDPDIILLTVTGNMVALEWIGRDDPAGMPVNGYLLDTRQEPRIERFKTSANRLIHKLCLPSFLSVNSQRVLFWLGLAWHDVDPEAPWGTLLAYGWRQGNLDTKRADVAWDLVKAELSAFRDAVERQDDKLVVTFSPARFTLSDSFRDNEKRIPKERLTIEAHERFRQICSALDIPSADTLEALRAKRLVHSRQGKFAPMYFLFDYGHLDRQGHAVVAEALLDTIDRQHLLEQSPP